MKILNKFLEQSSVVQTLIDKVTKSLDYISDNSIRNELICALKPFHYSTARTTIDIAEIKSMAAKFDIPMTYKQALKVLDNTRLDLDLNCVNDCIKYHFDEFISSQLDLERL
jgi:hypothetical protein